jgi:hypothetical protein
MRGCVSNITFPATKGAMDLTCLFSDTGLTIETAHHTDDDDEDHHTEHDTDDGNKRDDRYRRSLGTQVSQSQHQLEGQSGHGRKLNRRVLKFKLFSGMG